MSSRGDYIKQEFPKVLQQSLGIISNACAHFDISRNTYYYWYNNDPEFAAACDEVHEYVGDFVEGKLLQKIETGDTTAIIFYCKTKLKNRGFIERVENTGADGSPLFDSYTDTDAEMLESYIERKAERKVKELMNDR